MQEKAGEQGAAYIPMPKGRGFTPHFDKSRSFCSLILCYTVPIKERQREYRGRFFYTNERGEYLDPKAKKIY